ncbi:hypothetical protein P4M26_29675 [Pseudomonas aeruginosa]|nr:hypothetical protein [Pseudomonas aeruginosa]
MSYSAKSFSALINAMRADGITRLEQLARQPFPQRPGFLERGGEEMKALLDRRTDPTWMLYAAIIAWLAFSGL